MAACALCSHRGGQRFKSRAVWELWSRSWCVDRRGRSSSIPVGGHLACGRSGGHVAMRGSGRVVRVPNGVLFDAGAVRFEIGISNGMTWRLPTAATLIVVLVLAVGGALIGLVVHRGVGAAVGAAVLALGRGGAVHGPGFGDRAGPRPAELRSAPRHGAAV